MIGLQLVQGYNTKDNDDDNGENDCSCRRVVLQQLLRSPAEGDGHGPMPPMDKTPTSFHSRHFALCSNKRLRVAVTTNAGAAVISRIRAEPSSPSATTK